MPTKRVAIAMSGGVDSSVAAALLLEQGFEVVGLHMKLYDDPNPNPTPKSCCSLDDSMDARAVCNRLGIPFYVLDFQEEFAHTVIDYFVAEYARGRTPNPCVMCNQHIKNRHLLEKADELDCDYLATGHYARVQFNPALNRSQLVRPQDRHKDQTYFLYGTPAAELQRLLFPLADLNKDQVRAVASRYGFTSAAKPDSQGICFVPKDYRKFLETRLQQPPTPGDFVNLQGEVVGQHRGFAYYTVGQRKGLGISDATPYYVVRLDTDTNRVIVGKQDEALSNQVRVVSTNWVSIPSPEMPLQAVVKLRYAHKGTPCTIQPTQNGEVLVELEEPERFVALGQAAVFYENDVLLGGGWIESSA